MKSFDRVDLDPRQAYFNGLAPDWDRDGAGTRLLQQRREWLVTRLGLEPHIRVLDVGCGTGTLTHWLAQRVSSGRVVGVDFAEAMLAEARRRVMASHVEFRLVDVCAEPPGREEFDWVICYQVFPHFRDPLQALRNLAIATRPQGRLAVVHLVSRAAVNAFHASLPPPVQNDRLPSPSEWPRWLAQTGWELNRLEDEVDGFWLEARRVASLSH